MNTSELAAKMLQWETDKKALDQLEAEITNAVLEIGKTQNVGNVRATYTSGRREFDYETPGKIADKAVIDANTTITDLVDWESIKALIDPDIIAEHTHKAASINWSAVCKDAKIEPVVVREGVPSVKIKLME